MCGAQLDQDQNCSAIMKHCRLTDLPLSLMFAILKLVTENVHRNTNFQKEIKKASNVTDISYSFTVQEYVEL